jgi:glycosyltransferase involved in cell wall biosynthesis
MNKSTILMTAYAVHPHKGSEDGMGWRFILAAARKHRVIAITRVNNGPAIEAFLAKNDFEGRENLQFEYFDLPAHLRFWKRGGRFSSLYHWIWHASLPSFIKKKGFQFDIAHHVNFHCDWTPSHLWKLGKPFVWGPIGHHPKLPKDYLIETGGTEAWIIDRLKWQSKALLWKFSPALKKSVEKASTVFVMNSGVEKVLKLKKNQVKLMPSVGCSFDTDANNSNSKIDLNRENEKSTILFMGRFEVLKSPETVLRSFAVFYNNLEERDRENVVLKMVGKGSLLSNLQNLSKKLAIENAVEWTNWVAFNQINEIYKTASLFFFPSHEGAGMVVAEALAQGLPVLCYANEGPGELTNDTCAIRIPYTTHQEAIKKFAFELDYFYRNPSERRIMGLNAMKFIEENLTWERKGAILEEVYASLIIPKGIEVPQIG